MSKCRSCGAEILWAVTESGSKIPLSVESQERRFTVHRYGGAREGDDVRIAKNEKTYVSHFADCPDAEKWRSG